MTTGAKGQSKVWHQAGQKAPVARCPFDITISEVADADIGLLGELAQLQDKVFGAYRHNRLSELIQQALSKDSMSIYLALHKGHICGFIVLKHRPRRNEWIIRGIGVEKGYRRRGIGSALLASAITFVDGKKGAILVSYIDVKNSASLRLHRRMGFVCQEDPVLPASELRARMVFLHSTR